MLNNQLESDGDEEELNQRRSSVKDGEGEDSEGRREPSLTTRRRRETSLAGSEEDNKKV